MLFCIIIVGKWLSYIGFLPKGREFAKRDYTALREGVGFMNCMFFVRNVYISKNFKREKMETKKKNTAEINMLAKLVPGIAVKKNLEKQILAAAIIGCLFILFFGATNLFAAALCTPVSANLCAAVDDYADIYLNGHFINEYLYCDTGNAACTPVCVSLNATQLGYLTTSGNVIAVFDQNTNCCEVWASWSLDITCQDTTQVIISSDNHPVHMVFDTTCVNTPTPNPSPTPSGGRQWYDPLYTENGAWTTPVDMTAKKWGKRLFDPSTGDLLAALSYAATMSTGCGALWFREGFALTPVPTPLPPVLTIQKYAVPATGIQQGFLTFSLHICNTGGGTLGNPVKIIDTWVPAGSDSFRFDGFIFGGSNVGWNFTDPTFGYISADVNGPPTTITFQNGFLHNSCYDLLYTLFSDNPISQCTTWPNTVAVSYAPQPTLTAVSSALVSNFCPSPTVTPMPPIFTISKSANKTANIVQGDQLSFTIHLCNNGGYLNSGSMTVVDDWTSNGDNWQYNGPYYIGPVPGVPGLTSISGSSSGNTATFILSFAPYGFTGCVDIPMWITMTNKNTGSCTWNNIAWENLTNPTVGTSLPMTDLCTPTFTITPTFTATPTRTLTFTPTYTNTQLPGTQTITPTITRTATPSITPSITQTFTLTYTKTNTPTFTRTFTFTSTPTATQTTLSAQISLTKTIPSGNHIYILGDTVHYCLNYQNTGASAASFTLWDTIPAVTDFVSCTNGTYASGCGTQTFGSYVLIVWTVTNIPAGQSDSVCFDVKINRLPYLFENREFIALLEDDKYFACLKDNVSVRRHVFDSGQDPVLWTQ
jgi:hypothetical protein